MREACRIAANVLESLARALSPGISTYDLDQMGKRLIEGYGAKSACFAYKVGTRSYPGYICVSVNDEVVHGIGCKDKIIALGDIVSLDVCVRYNGFVGDTARTVALGPIAADADKLLKETQKSLDLGIQAARSGKRVGDISSAIQQHIESRGLSIVKDFVGHGVGRSMHEEPQIPNFGRKGTGPKLAAGMTLAIEPMVNLGGSAVRYAADQWTAITADASLSAHFEHTILITDTEAEILTIHQL